MVRELAHIRIGLLMIIFERLWQSTEVHDNWEKANVTPVFKQGRREKPGTYWPVSLTFMP